MEHRFGSGTECILENTPPTFTAAQLRVFLCALVNLDPYTITDDKLTGFARRLFLTGYVGIPREGEFD